MKPEENYERYAGFRVEEDKAQNFSVFGEVLAVPDRLIYCARLGSKSLRQRKKFQRLNEKSLEWKTKMELKVGDRVMFHYKARLDDENFEDGTILMPYDQILAVVRGEKVIPVNGYLFVEVEEIVNEENRPVSDGYGTLKAVSATGNADYKFSIRKDTAKVKVGQKVYFNPKQGYPVEYTLHQEFHNLVAIRRKDIYLCV